MLIYPKVCKPIIRINPKTGIIWKDNKKIVNSINPPPKDREGAVFSSKIGIMVNGSVQLWRIISN